MRTMNEMIARARNDLIALHALLEVQSSVLQPATSTDRSAVSKAMRNARAAIQVCEERLTALEKQRDRMERVIDLTRQMRVSRPCDQKPCQFVRRQRN